MSRVVDACCTINLYAAGNLLTLLPAYGGEWHVPPVVIGEAQSIRRPSPDDPTKLVKEPMDLRPAFAAGVLRHCTPTEEEEALFVEYAADLGDGEAMCLAIAQTRGWTLATDDRPAWRTAGERGVAVVTTAEIVKCWADATSAEEGTVIGLLRNIQTFGRFVPHRTMPLHAWWVDLIGRSGR